VAHPDWRLHFTTFDLPLDAVDQAGTPQSETHRMIEDYLAGHQDTTLGGTRPALLTYLSLALVLVGLGVLLAGPAPVTGSRWYWFWLGGVPFGLGLLYWLARERPWADPTPPPLDHRTGRPRSAISARPQRPDQHIHPQTPPRRPRSCGTQVVGSRRLARLGSSARMRRSRSRSMSATLIPVPSLT
jgi:hypothetical protein